MQGHNVLLKSKSVRNDGKRQEAMDGIKICRNRRACVLGRRSREKPTFIYIIDLEIALEEGEGERVNFGQPIDSVVFA